MLAVRVPPGWSHERRYAIGVVVGDFLGLDHHVERGESFDVEITLDGDESSRRLLVYDGLFSHDEPARLTYAALPTLPLEEEELPAECKDVRVVSRRVPVVYGRPDREQLVAADGNLIRVELDVFGSTFLFLTRLEEAIRSERDEHGRFPSGASLASRAGFLERPLVNEYAEILWWAIARLWPRLERTERSFRCLPSHDVDWTTSRGIGLGPTLRAVGADIVLRHEIQLAGRRLASALMSGLGRPHRDVYDTFDLIMDLSEAAGLRSAFNFIPQPSPSGLNGNYSINAPDIRRLLRRVHERGHEIGLHSSYESGDDPSLVAPEAECLSRACREEGIDLDEWGGRQHYLRFGNPATWRGWDDAGLAYDSTLGFPDAAGFRCGTCYEYQVFDIETRRPLRLRERPLIVMERATLDRRARSADAAVDEMRLLAERCRLFGGDFTLLWHNSRLLSRVERRAYESMLA